jgi:hypothetical protein
MEENEAAPETGEVRIQNGKVEVFDGERWGPYRAIPAPPGVHVPCRCMKHNRCEPRSHG